VSDCSWRGSFVQKRLRRRACGPCGFNGYAIRAVAIAQVEGFEWDYSHERADKAPTLP
jgi:hypothetical protein